MNLLATSQSVLGYGVKYIPSIELNWIGVIIRWLIEGVGIIGVGIVLFTLILKTIVLPLDIYSRIKSKKQALIMEKMRPQMEKLQKQYANDKQMYSQKVMELQKKSGYSMFGACIPMIVSLVIFLFVFNAFSTYSQYANLESYNDMVTSYNSVVYAYVQDEENPEGFLIETRIDGQTDYYVDFGAFAQEYNRNNSTTLSEDEVFTALMDKYTEEKGTLVADGAENSQDTTIREAVRLTLVSYYIDGFAAQKVAEDYYAKMNSPEIDGSYEESYNKVTAALGNEKNTYNGYFVLIVLSIGVMLLQQFISMKMNKSVNELGSVDGSGARTMKVMMIVMPIMYGIFAFMYSSAFSIYMITNTTYSIITTLIINKSMNVWFAKKEHSSEINKMSHNKK